MVYGWILVKDKMKKYFLIKRGINWEEQPINIVKCSLYSWSWKNTIMQTQQIKNLKERIMQSN